MTDDLVDQVLTSLKIVAMIKEGQKVCIRNGLLTLETHSTGVKVAIRRWINRDNRRSTLSYIKNVVNNAFDIAGMHQDEATVEKLKLGLKDCILGLGCLAVTYNNDASITASVEVMQDRIRSRIEF
jgi:hypothetical protein